MKTPAAVVLAALTGLALWSCAEQSDPGVDPGVITGPAQARVPAECSTGDLARAARGFFSNPERREVVETLRVIEGACADGVPSEVVAGGWAILRAMEEALVQGRAGDADDGARLANGLVAADGLMCAVDGSSLCDFMVPPEPIVPAALSEQGIFAVREEGMEPILARGLVPFCDELSADEVPCAPNNNDALWLVTTTGDSWASATNAGGAILIYGQPTSYSRILEGHELAEVSFGDLAFELNSFPNVDGFNEGGGEIPLGQVHVGVCFGATGVEVPHLTDDDSPKRLERLQREGTVLSVFTGLTSSACEGFRRNYEPLARARTSLDRLFAWAADALQPEPLFAALVSDRRAPLSSGTPIDFSIIAPVAASPEGRVMFLNAPGDGTPGEHLGAVDVQVLTGGRVPMELVRVELYVAGNEGEPAGAGFCTTADCSTTVDVLSELTVEADDGRADGTFASFPDVRIGKTGGYTVCARVPSPETNQGGNAEFFRFDEACVRLNIRGN